VERADSIFRVGDPETRVDLSHHMTYDTLHTAYFSYTWIGHRQVVYETYSMHALIYCVDGVGGI